MVPFPERLIWSLTTVHGRNEAPDCAWSKKGEGVTEIERGRQDRVGGDTFLIVDTMVENPFSELSILVYSDIVQVPHQG